VCLSILCLICINIHYPWNYTDNNAQSLSTANLYKVINVEKWSGFFGPPCNFQNGRWPPSWILSNRKWRRSSKDYKARLTTPYQLYVTVVGECIVGNFTSATIRLEFVCMFVYIMPGIYLIIARQLDVIITIFGVSYRSTGFQRTLWR